MDSGNSGSMQSSSGGDDEYDSRAPESSFPTYLGPSGHFGQLSNLHQPSLLFDPSPNLFGAFSHSSPSLNPNSSSLNLDMIGSVGLRSDPICTDHGNNKLRGISSSSSLTSNQPILGTAEGSNQTPLSSMQLRSVHDNKGAGSSQTSDHTHVVARNPKKRTRASRRAPTTVLNTDTSNFRAMVQEFTGIPEPPFSGSPYSRRFDLFGTGSGLRSGHHPETMESFYRLRPSLQKVHQQSQLVPSSSSSFFTNDMVNAANTGSPIPKINTTVAANIAATTSTSSNSNCINYQLPSELGGLSKQPQNLMMSIQNQMFPYQSLLPNQSLQPSLNVNNSATLSAEELGLSQGHVTQVNSELGGLSGHHAITEGRRPRDHNNSWKDGLGSDQGSQDQLRLLEDNNHSNSLRANNCKFNYSAPSSDFRRDRDKGLENASSRGEGTVDSWICPSE
ncbi:hypothetical protein K2173_011158 [Erythroxylum novogranatense]|uniref:VQ domain-containing protein n=1 Tax=Erythroxylum novogranatense TaxID=1862640 RepID=A0AAV8T8X0_9ROSI|nr:hypothetical protein K2173_011158 [Erythroxylum novogranatense]